MLKSGDRVKGLRSHKGKSGVIIETHDLACKIKWDNAKRQSWVYYENLALATD